MTKAVTGGREPTEAQEAISAAALRLFVRQGYAGTTMEEVARAAGVSRATVFRHFGSKEGILFARHHRELDQLRAALRARAGMDEGRALRTILLEFAGRLEADRDAFSVEVGLMAGHPRLLARALVTMHDWADTLAWELAGGRREGAVELRVRVLVHSALSALQEAICTWRNAEPGASLVALADEALHLVLPGGSEQSR
jgi:AcrR family transcriptional regulator